MRPLARPTSRRPLLAVLGLGSLALLATSCVSTGWRGSYDPYYRRAYPYGTYGTYRSYGPRPYGYYSGPRYVPIYRDRDHWDRDRWDRHDHKRDRDRWRRGDRRDHSWDGPEKKPSRAAVRPDPRPDRRGQRPDRARMERRDRRPEPGARQAPGSSIYRPWHQPGRGRGAGPR